MTQNPWCSLFLTCDNGVGTQATIAQQLRDALKSLGYTLYDPFGTIPSKSYHNTVRSFVAAEDQNWVRLILSEPPPKPLLATVTLDCAGMLVTVRAGQAEIDIYRHSERVDSAADVLREHLREGATIDALQNALTRMQVTLIPPDENQPNNVPYDALPDDIRDMGAGVSPDAVSKMFGKITGNLLRKAGGSSDDVEGANALLGQGKINWDAPSVQALQDVIDLLTVPQHWREPDFIALRDAYGLHARRQRKPNARLYPGDAETMAAVPAALSYIPVYGGKD